MDGSTGDLWNSFEGNPSKGLYIVVPPDDLKPQRRVDGAPAQIWHVVIHVARPLPAVEKAEPDWDRFGFGVEEEPELPKRIPSVTEQLLEHFNSCKAPPGNSVTSERESQNEQNGKSDVEEREDNICDHKPTYYCDTKGLVCELCYKILEEWHEMVSNVDYNL